MFNLATYRNSLARSTKSTTLEVFFLCLLVGARFQVLFHSPPGVLFTFPSQYCSTIGHQVVFRLGGWSPRLPCGFHVSAGTLDTVGHIHISCTRLLRSLVWLPNQFYYASMIPYTVLNPEGIATLGLPSFLFARRYSENLF